MRLLILIGLFVSVLGILVVDMTVDPISQQSEISRAQNEEKSEVGGEQIEQLIKKLWSPSEQERLNAKSQLIESGRKAVHPLIALLRDLTERNEPRFLTGKEKEGAELLRHFHDNSNQLSPYYVEEIKKIEISSRLKRDSSELLCHLKAEEAVPILIESLREKYVLSKKNEERKAIACFGSLAIPKIIDAIESAQKSPAFLIAQRRGLRNFSEKQFIVKLLLTLEAIRDDRALDFLEKLKNETADKDIRTLTGAVIKAIKEKNRIKSKRTKTVSKA